MFIYTHSGLPILHPCNETDSLYLFKQAWVRVREISTHERGVRRGRAPRLCHERIVRAGWEHARERELRRHVQGSHFNLTYFINQMVLESQTPPQNNHFEGGLTF